MTTTDPPPDKHSAFRSWFVSHDRNWQRAYYKSLSPAQKQYFWRHPDLLLFDKQLIPEGMWHYCLLRCGRRFGKGIAGSAWIAQKVIQGCLYLAIAGQDYKHVFGVMKRDIFRWFPKGTAHYDNNKHTITFTHYPAIIYCYTAAEEIRGNSVEYIWADEVRAWSENPDKIVALFDSLDTMCSVGAHPQTLITSTPRAFQWFFDYQAQIDKGNPNYLLLKGSMFDNPYLSAGYIQKELDKYKHDPARLASEIYGELTYSDPHALFQPAWIEDARFTDPDNPKKDPHQDLTYFWKQVLKKQVTVKSITISIDPAVTNNDTSDETGILVVSQDFKNHYYVLQDASGRHTPDQWARTVIELYRHYDKLFPGKVRIVAEVNQGGDLVISNLTVADASLKSKIIAIHANKGKLLRAEPVAAKYERGLVHHVGTFDVLERQMCNYTGHKHASPDHLDALCHAINYLAIVPKPSKPKPRILSQFDNY
jgi:phage terminase large subunit-like protein